VRSKKEITNWGKYPVADANEFVFDSESHLRQVLNAPEYKPWIARGAGRCYGDASLGGNIVSTLHYSNILEFDTATGELYCEAGVTLEELLEVIIPEGFFLPVTPGTKFITVGGAVASDIHGKNHHKEGSFSAHIIRMDIYAADGNVYNASRTEHADLFEATCGGMGLTGIILRVRFKLKKIESAYIKQVTARARNLDEIFDLFEEHRSWTYSMSWIDCFQKGGKLGRSIMYAGEHATLSDLDEKRRKNPLHVPAKRKLTVPFNLPSITLNPLSIRAFNFLYYNKSPRTRHTGLFDYDTFFYPLDSILHWNRMYGKSGFVQYQFVLPLAVSKKGLTEILTRINKANMGSFLAVLKLFGKQDDLISFPMEGYTLALDFAVRKGLFEFLDELDKIVMDLGGRIYLSKDARMKPDFFWKSYPRVNRFAEIVRKYNPDTTFSSTQSERLLLTKLS
jgi:decaprenylphospho-beta-D-ribofuranose 2-oxidase